MPVAFEDARAICSLTWLIFQETVFAGNATWTYSAGQLVLLSAYALTLTDRPLCVSRFWSGLSLAGDCVGWPIVRTR